MGERLEIDLYQHDETDRALLLSVDGVRGEWIPKSLVSEPSKLRIIKPGDKPLARGQFEIETWKLSELGWEDGAREPENEKQGKLF